MQVWETCTSTSAMAAKLSILSPVRDQRDATQASFGVSLSHAVPTRMGGALVGSPFVIARTIARSVSARFRSRSGP